LPRSTLWDVPECAHEAKHLLFAQVSHHACIFFHENNGHRVCILGAIMKTVLAPILLCCLSSAALATADGPDHYRVRGIASGVFLEMRSAPGADAAVLAKIPAGMTCLRNLGCQGGLTLQEFTTLSDEEKRRRTDANPRWCKVDYRGTVGWVPGQSLAEDACRKIAPDQIVMIVEFPRGRNAVAIAGRIQGREFIDYRLRAGAGQHLAVTMKAANLGAYFNVLPPGSDNVAMYIGQIGGNRFDGVLPGDGDYTLRVYLVRSAARRNEATDYGLNVELSGAALEPVPAAQDTLLPGTPFHASTTVPCALPYEPDTKLCKAFVIRRGHDGTATVEVRSAKSYLRRILFVKNEPVASDAAQPMTHSRQGDRIRVQFGPDEWAELIDALLTGG